MLTGKNKVSRELGQKAYEENFLVDDHILDNFVWDEEDQIWREEK